FVVLALLFFAGLRPGQLHLAEARLHAGEDVLGQAAAGGRDPGEGDLAAAVAGAPDDGARERHPAGVAREAGAGAERRGLERDLDRAGLAADALRADRELRPAAVVEVEAGGVDAVAAGRQRAPLQHLRHAAAQRRAVGGHPADRPPRLDLQADGGAGGALGPGGAAQERLVQLV